MLTKLLLVEDDLVDQMAFRRRVEKDGLGYLYSVSSSVAEATTALKTQPFDVVVADYSLGDGLAFDILDVAADLPVIVTTGAGDENIAAQVMKAGAFDYLVKDPDRNYLDTLPMIVESAIKSKEREKRFTMLSHALMSINDNVCICGLDGKIILVNKAFLHTYQYESTEIVGKNHKIILSDQDPEKIEAIRKGTLAGGWSGEVSNLRKDGSEFPGALTTSLVHNDRGEPIGLTIVVKDVTEQRRAHDALRRAKEIAEAANRSKSDFLANMSHEIRTPMNSILGMTDLALDTPLLPQQKEFIQIVKSSAESLLTIIDDILDFSKIGAGKLELAPSEFSLHAMLSDVLRTFSLRANQLGVELATYVSPDIPDNLIGDSLRLRQILVNLIGNSLKFTEQGSVIVCIEKEKSKSQGIRLHFSVTDTGIGIPEAHQASIFNSFEQADGSATRKYGGTGLGLAISSELVKMMSGRIWVESPVRWQPNGASGKKHDPELESDSFFYHPGPKAGAGSRFHFIAKLKTQELADSKIGIGAPDLLRDFSVLIADGHAVNRKFVFEWLTFWGCTVVAARDSVEVLQKIDDRKAPFQLLILDENLPDLAKQDLAQKLNSHPMAKETPIIRLSTVAGSEKSAPTHALEMFPRLIKPVNLFDLLENIRGLAIRREGNSKAQAPETIKESPESLKSLRILLVEDNLANQKLAKILLERQGHEVTIAEDGKHAIDLWRHQEFDLILMDIQMPEMDGFEATARIRELEKETGGHTIIIALTANAMKGYQERCIAGGMDGYVSKPIKKQELKSKIETIMEERRQENPSIQT